MMCIKAHRLSGTYGKYGNVSKVTEENLVHFEQV